MDADLYRRSSQYRTWSFTRDQLHQLRITANRRAVPNEISLTADEELALVTYFAVEKMQAFTDVFRLPSQVRATAVAYFRRFYLMHSVMEYEPRLILPTAVFLASKSENYFIPIDKFVEPLEKIEQTQILELEFSLFKSLEFTLTVHNALKPLHGFYLDMQGPNAGDNIGTLGKIHDDARKIVVASFSSDALFLFTPSQIALAALMEVDESHVTEYMAQVMDGPNTGLDRLLTTIQSCRDALRVPEVPTKDQLKPIMRRLKEYMASQRNEGPSTKKLRSA